MIKLIISDLARTCLFLKDANWTGTINEYYSSLLAKGGEIDFAAEFILDHEYLAGLKFYADRGIKLVAFTSGQIQHMPPLKAELDKYFSEVLSPKEVGFQKDEAVAFQKIAERFELQPSEVVHIDDEPTFIAAAREAGCKVVQHKDRESSLAELRLLVDAASAS